eukprot:355034-Chlamydomonas_euryale.AAC.1
MAAECMALTPARVGRCGATPTRSLGPPHACVPRLDQVTVSSLFSAAHAGPRLASHTHRRQLLHAQHQFAPGTGGPYPTLPYPLLPTLAAGSCTMRYASLHQAQITSMAYLPESDLLITAASDSGAVVGGWMVGHPKRCERGREGLRHQAK